MFPSNLSSFVKLIPKLKSRTYPIDEDFTLDVVEEEDENKHNDTPLIVDTGEIEPKSEVVDDVEDEDEDEHNDSPLQSNTEKIERTSEVVDKSVKRVNERIEGDKSIEKVNKKGRSRYNCDLCGYWTIRYKTLESHIKKHSSSPSLKLIKCQYCDFEAFEKVILSMHLRCCAPAHKKVKCPHCNFVTMKHKNLTAHLNSMHTETGAYIYKCHKCSYFTEDPNLFREHKRGHVVKKSMKCSVCDFETFDKLELRKHVPLHKRKVPGTVLKRQKGIRQMYSCDLCDYESLFSSNVIRHRTKHLNQ